MQLLVTNEVVRKIEGFWLQASDLTNRVSILTIIVDGMVVCPGLRLLIFRRPFLVLYHDWPLLYAMEKYCMTQICI